MGNTSDHRQFEEWYLLLLLHIRNRPKSTSKIEIKLDTIVKFDWSWNVEGKLIIKWTNPKKPQQFYASRRRVRELFNRKTLELKRRVLFDLKSDRLIVWFFPQIFFRIETLQNVYLILHFKYIAICSFNFSRLLNWQTRWKKLNQYFVLSNFFSTNDFCSKSYCCVCVWVISFVDRSIKSPTHPMPNAWTYKKCYQLCHTIKYKTTTKCWIFSTQTNDASRLQPKSPPLSRRTTAVVFKLKKFTMHCRNRTTNFVLIAKTQMWLLKTHVHYEMVQLLTALNLIFNFFFCETFACKSLAKIENRFLIFWNHRTFCS